ncbi:hypothetical protein ADIARSV_3556 [Arcticibacter svalbardensis MN12-7]|uniref:Uncharacterized protein n=1 Tax=Arcticibacter svalbardensis MN12-7 TaxID=1150600 RepID=R9GNL6_9SPHI|nr:hypothetical protein [Arcticibacter svalbardensis]EOR93291.1 hypothetical protein ADIARSV_3556 [Arcticibacter svalbardensis MN12-7]
MAEIKVEKKKSITPWILLGLGIIALLLYFLGVFDKKESLNNDASTNLIGVRENDSTVLAYVSFINGDNAKMSLDHEFTNEALIKLTHAVDTMAVKAGFSVKADLDKAKEYADHITNDPFETTHADNIRRSAEIISDALQNLQKAKYPTLANDISEVKDAVGAIDPDVLTLDQREAVKGFLSKSAHVLEKMN